VKTASTLFVNTLAQLFAKLVTTGTTLLVTYLISKNLGTIGLGEFFAATSYVALFYLLADFGINAVFTKKINGVENQELIRETQDYQLTHLFKNLLSLRLILGILVMFVAISFLAFLGYPTTVKVAIIFASVLILNQALFMTANAIFQIKLQYAYSAAAEVFGGLLSLLLVYLFTRTQIGILPIIFAYIIGGLGRALLGLVLARRLAGGIGLGGDTHIWKALFLSSLPLGIMAIFVQIMVNIDKVILALVPLSSDLGYSNIQAVGIYGLAFKFFDVALVLPTYAMNAAFPIFVKTESKNRGELLAIAKKIGLVLVGLGILFSILGFFLTPFILSLFNQGEDLQGSITTLRILLFGLPLFYLSALLVWLSVALNRQKWLIIVYLLAALVNIGLNLRFIPTVGYLASAWITLLSECVVVVGGLFLVWDSYRKQDHG
jgi:O-antigen/teichoic acid export membrane protein